MHYDIINIVIIIKYNFCGEISKTIFFILQLRPNLQSKIYYHRHLEWFKMVFGSRDWAIEILTVISVLKCQFLVKSENWTKICACCSCKVIINDEFLVYIHSLAYNKNCTTPCFIILISNRTNFTLRGPSSLHLHVHKYIFNMFLKLLLYTDCAC